MHPYGPEQAKCPDHEQRPDVEAITQAINLTDEVEELICVDGSHTGCVTLRDSSFGASLPDGMFKAFIDDDGLRFQLPCCQWNERYQHIDVFAPEGWNRPYRTHRIPSTLNIRVELQGSTHWPDSANPMRDLMATMETLRERLGHISSPLDRHWSAQPSRHLPRGVVGYPSSQRPRYYTLNGHTPVPCYDVQAWGRWFEQADRWVGSTAVRGFRVSTIFLGLDHSFSGEGDPILFQTTVSSEEREVAEWRYSTWEQAARGHRTIVNGLFQGLSVDDIAEQMET